MSWVDPLGNTNNSNNPIWMNTSGVNSTAIAAGKTTDTVIKASTGVFYGVVITTVAVGTPTVFDNATAGSGKIVGIVPASAALGINQSIPAGITCNNGITVAGGATTNPAMLILWM